MGKVFISYSRAPLDSRVADYLASYLREREHAVFIDRNSLTGGEHWADSIEHELRAADSLVVLLSPSSIVSLFVLHELRLAVEREDGGLRIFPVRLAFDEKLPFEMGAYLKPVQSIEWRSASDDERVAELLHSKISRDEPSDRTAEALPATEPAPEFGPLRDRVLPDPDAPVRLDSEFYVVRRSDLLLEQDIHLDGTTIMLTGTRQTGKSSLLKRAESWARAAGYRSCLVDLLRADESDFQSLDRILRFLARQLQRGFNASIQPRQTWADDLGPKDNLMEYIEKAILEARGEVEEMRCIVLVDHADRVLKYPCRHDFFSFFRLVHTERASVEIWRRLNVVLAYSKEPHLHIEEINASPFNVGKVIRLEDFTADHVRELNTKLYGGLQDDEDMKGFTDLVGGQPYLVLQGLYCVAHNGWNFSKLKQVAVSYKGPFGEHLQWFVSRLERNRNLKECLQQILLNGGCKEEQSTDFHRLRTAGLVIGDSPNQARMRCGLYEEFFSQLLLQ